jgi:hypothetical protein
MDSINERIRDNERISIDKTVGGISISRVRKHAVIFQGQPKIICSGIIKKVFEPLHYIYSKVRRLQIREAMSNYF